ncbi:MAG: aquaporin [Desulfobacterales bacterium]|nr:aquaporin [Desulfobacterales bacterium]
MLVFAGTGAIVANNFSQGAVSHTGIALVFGFVVMSMIYSVGEKSGAHLNPAVTLAFYVAGRFDKNQILPYFAAQFSGSIFASLLLKLFINLPGSDLGATLPSIPPVNTFCLEIILTFILMFVIIHVATGSKEQGLMAGIAIGGTVAFEAMFAGPFTGASMNPARSLGPALISGNTQALWIYLTAPFIGAVLAIFFWRFIMDIKMKKSVLFVCIHNSARSQMAEAYLKKAGSKKFEVFSAGLEPGNLNSVVVEAMKQDGIDISGNRTKSVNEFLDAGVEFDYVITVCDESSAEQCPVFLGKGKRMHWGFEDPSALEGSFDEKIIRVKQIRDQIRTRIDNWLEEEITAQ